MNEPIHEIPGNSADSLTALQAVYDLLASAVPGELPGRLTERLRDLTDAQTVCLLARNGDSGHYERLSCDPPQRTALFTDEELQTFAPEQRPEPLLAETAPLPHDDPLRILLQRAGVQSVWRLPLQAAGEPVGLLLLFDLPGSARVSDTASKLKLLAAPIALAVKNVLTARAIHWQRLEMERYSQELERRVQQRTADLEAVNRSLAESRLAALNVMEDAVAARQRAEQSNAALRHEIEQRELVEESLRQSEARFRRAVLEAPIPIILHAEDGEILQLSESWCEITGYSRQELATVDDWTERAYGERKAVVQQGIDRLHDLDHRMAEGDFPIRTRNGTTRIWDFSSAPLGRLPDGRRLVISMAMDVTDRRKSEADLRASLADRELLLKEVHHRVKNNLQIVASLLNLQVSRTADPQIRMALRDTQNRIHSMALLHEVLYRSPSLARLDFPTYVQELCRYLLRSSGTANVRVRIEPHVAPVGLPLDRAVPCGLLINELVSNAIKHGFPDERSGCVRVELQTLDEPDGATAAVIAAGQRRLALSVGDDGIGLPADFEQRRTKSLGLKLVGGLAQQLGGHLTIQRSAGGGTVFRIEFALDRERTSST